LSITEIEYDKKPLNLEIIKHEDFDEYVFNSPYEDIFYNFKKSTFYLFKPEKFVKGDIIFLHGIGNGNIPFLMWYARYFRKLGYRTSFVIMPYHLSRTPEGEKAGDTFYSAEPCECVKKFHFAVKDVRRVIDILEGMPSYSSKRLYLMGMSFGGIIGSISLALDQRISKGALLVTGGNWRWINFHSPYTLKIKYEVETKGNSYGCTGELKCIEHFRKEPVKYILNNFKKIEDIFKLEHVGCYKYDPLSFAPFIEQEVLFLRAVFDKVIPKNASLELKSLIKNVVYRRIPTGHKSSILLRKYIAKMVLKFFN